MNRCGLLQYKLFFFFLWLEVGTQIKYFQSVENQEEISSQEKKLSWVQHRKKSRFSKKENRQEIHMKWQKVFGSNFQNSLVISSQFKTKKEWCFWSPETMQLWSGPFVHPHICPIWCNKKTVGPETSEIHPKNDRFPSPIVASYGILSLVIVSLIPKKKIVSHTTHIYAFFCASHVTYMRVTFCPTLVLQGDNSSIFLKVESHMERKRDLALLSVSPRP